MSADVKVSDLGPFGDSLGLQNGESRQVCPLLRRPGWLYKEYRTPLSAAEGDRLAQLIRLPSQMTREQIAVVGRHVSWPDRRVVNDAGQTVGVLLPQAPDAYQYNWKLPSGRTERKLLEVDVLALSEDVQAKRGLPPQPFPSRLKVCASIAAVGGLFEKYRLVYLDWSYSNIFWSVQDQTAYVIDMDGCSFGPRPQIQQPGWDDPLVPFGQAGNECDRYRIALLIARCLTGERVELKKTQSRLSSLRLHSAEAEEAVDLILRSLSAQTTDARPSVARLSAALSAAAGLVPPPFGDDLGRVKGWKPVQSKNPDSVWSPPTANAGRPAGTSARSADSASFVGAAGKAGATSTSPAAQGFQASPSSYSAQPPVKPSSGSTGAVVTGVLIVIAIIIILAVTL